MKLQQETPADLNVITGYGADYIEVNKERFTTSILVFATGPVEPWDATDFNTLSADDFALLLTPGPDASAGKRVSATGGDTAAPADDPVAGRPSGLPELILFGTGARLRFAHPRLFAALNAKRIGVETMDSTAACRTFNILVGEGRRAVAALLLEPT